MRDSIDVQSARSNVSSYQHACAAVTEFSQSCFALWLAAVSMNAIHTVIARFENVRNTLGAATSARKDEHAFKWFGFILQQRKQKSRL